MIPTHTSLHIVFAALIAASIAQIIKFFICVNKKQKMSFKIFMQMGGMPSNISAFIVSIATSVALICGYRSVEFAIALGFSMVVMYDAAGLRRSASKIGAVLNKVVDEHYQDKNAGFHSEKIFEVLGHTPFEVFVGGILGILVTIGYFNILLR